jgi:hypothetical protein
LPRERAGINGLPRTGNGLKIKRVSGDFYEHKCAIAVEVASHFVRPMEVISASFPRAPLNEVVDVFHPRHSKLAVPNLLGKEKGTA